MVINNLFLLPFLKPEITGYQTIMLIDLAIAFLPVPYLLADSSSQLRNRYAGTSVRFTQ